MCLYVAEVPTPVVPSSNPKKDTLVRGLMQSDIAFQRLWPQRM